MKGLSIIGMILFCVAIAAMSMRCNLQRSELIKDDKLTIECKLAIEAFYYLQKSADKSTIVAIVQACKESNRFSRCEKFIENRTLFAECKELLK
jgi:hypothetical protein